MLWSCPQIVSNAKQFVCWASENGTDERILSDFCAITQYCLEYRVCECVYLCVGFYGFLLLLLLPFLLSNFYFFVHVCASDLHPKSSSIIGRQPNYDSILLFCMFFFLFTYYKLNNSTTDYLLSDLQSCSTKQSVHNTTLNGAFHPFFASFTLSFFCNCRYNLKRKKNMFSFFSLFTNQSMNVNIRLYIYVR